MRGIGRVRSCILVNSCDGSGTVRLSSQIKLMKSNNQIEVIVFKQPLDAPPLFLMLKRAEDRGGFWQPVTGGVEVNESLEAAAKRELFEETGLTHVVRLIDTGFSYSFVDNGREHQEWIFGAEVHPDVIVQLSTEHTEAAWVTSQEAINDYLKWPGNKQGLTTLSEMIGA